MKVDLAREIALKILFEIEEKKAYSNIVLDEYLDKNREKLSNRDINFISELVYGITTWKLTIDVIIKKYSKINLKKISPWVINILRLGIYQTIFLDKVPKSAAVNESVNLTKKYAYKSTGFVNAILRKVEKVDYEELSTISNEEERISNQYSLPLWIVNKFIKQYGVEKAEEIAKYSNERPKLTIRANTFKLTEEKLENELQKRDIEYKKSNTKNFIYVDNVKNLSKLDLFENGYFTVQDEGAGEIVTLLGPKSGEIVLDACGAPGGKTTYIAELMKNNGEIFAWDIHEHRVKLINENAKRLGLNIIRAEKKDATKYEEKYYEKFDRILLDVPCMGLGVMKRKPDIKWQRQEKEIEEIAQIQLNILLNCSKYLKKNGILVYSTCSLLKEENEDIVKQFVKIENYNILEQKNIMVTKKNDGFFACKLQKI